MKLGLVGRPFAGRSTLLTALGGTPDPAGGEARVSTPVRDPRLEAMRDLFRPKKFTPARAEYLDLPGLPEGDGAAGKAERVGRVRDADALVIVLDAFTGTDDPAATLAGLEEEFLLADFEVLSGRLERLRHSKTAKSERADEERETAVLERIHGAMEADLRPVSEVEMSAEERKALSGFRFLTEKPRIVVVNTSDPATTAEDAGVPGAVALCLEIEAEIAGLEAADAERAEFLAGFGLDEPAVDRLVRASLGALGLICFFTVGEDEVRAWPVAAGATAVEAAGEIHSDLARGFIRAEMCTWEQMTAAGGEREAKAAGVIRLEERTAVVSDGDILHVRFSV